MKKSVYSIVTCIMAGMLMAQNAAAQTIYTFSGGASGFSGDGGPASAAQLYRPGTIRHDNAGNIYVMDASNARIRKISGSTYTITTVAGTGTMGYSGDGGPATSANINPGTNTGGDMVIDNSNNIYFSDLLNNCIRKISSSGTISTIAGTAGTAGSSGDGGAATAAYFDGPMGLALDAAGNLYIADHSNSRIRKITAATGIITTVAGNGTAASTGDGGAATAASIEYPSGVAVDAAGNVYFNEYLTGKIRKIDATSGNISTFATGLYQPVFMEFDQAGYLFSGSNDTRVYRINTTGVVDTVAGNGTALTTPSGDGGSPTAAGIWRPCGVSITPAGNMLISTNLHHRIRIVTAAAATVTGTVSTCAGSTTTLSATPAGAAWRTANPAVATVSASGVVTGVAAGTATIAYVRGLLFGSQVVTVNAPVTPVITASGSTLSVPASYSSYQWLHEGTAIAGATTATHTATLTGNYTVRVGDAGGCEATSASYMVGTLSVNALGNNAGLSLSPNPTTTGNLNILVNSPLTETATITITDLAGRTMAQYTTTTNTSTTLPLTIPAGLYLAKAATPSAIYTSKVVVQ